MSRIAYRLWSIKEEQHYVDAGFTLIEAQQIINLADDMDEDYTRKTDYIKAAKSYTTWINGNANLSKPLTWELLFGEPEDIGYRYCSKCGSYFWEDEECDCDYDW